MRESLAEFIGKELVVDTASNWVFLGTLETVSQGALVLRDADAHDISDTDATKERYIYDARTYGIKANRAHVHVGLSHVVSVSLLRDVNAF